MKIRSKKESSNKLHMYCSLCEFIYISESTCVVVWSCCECKFLKTICDKTCFTQLPINHSSFYFSFPSHFPIHSKLCVVPFKFLLNFTCNQSKLCSFCSISYSKDPIGSISSTSSGTSQLPTTYEFNLFLNSEKWGFEAFISSTNPASGW